MVIKDISKETIGEKMKIKIIEKEDLDLLEDYSEGMLIQFDNPIIIEIKERFY